MTWPILCLRGAPGVGKSTAAVQLRERGVAIVEVDDLRSAYWHYPYAGAYRGDLHELGLHQAATVALALRAAGVGRVAVVDTFNVSCMRTFQLALRGRAEALPVALVAKPDVLAKRLRDRPDAPGVFRDERIAMALNDELSALLATERLDTTQLTPDDVVEAMWRTWASAQPHGSVAWSATSPP